MTPEARLNQIESILETAARYINRHEQAFERQEQAFARHEQVFERQEQAFARHEQAIADLEMQQQQINERMIRLIDLFTELTAISRQNQEEMRQTKEEMRQNQEEIRRIWEYLLSQSDNGNSASS